MVRSPASRVSNHERCGHKPSNQNIEFFRHGMCGHILRQRKWNVLTPHASTLVTSLLTVTTSMGRFDEPIRYLWPPSNQQRRWHDDVMMGLLDREFYRP